MPLIKAIDAPLFDAPFMTATGLAAPSRGSKENSAWRFTMYPGNPGHHHAVTREEIFVAITGQGVVTVDGESHDFCAGDALIIPADTMFGISNPTDEPFEVIAILPVGAQAYTPGTDPINPSWAQ